VLQKKTHCHPILDIHHIVNSKWHATNFEKLNAANKFNSRPNSAIKICACHYKKINDKKILCLVMTYFVISKISNNYMGR
jgi:hypothetical protein